MSAHNIDS